MKLDILSPQFLFGLASFVLALVSSSHAIIRRRDPRAALFWAVVIWMLPVAGSILYYSFGINRIERRAVRLRRRRSPPEIEKDNAHFDLAGLKSKFSARQNLEVLSRLVGRVVKLPLCSGNKIQPLFNGEGAYPAMIEAIDRAQSSVALMTYIFENDRAGRLFLDALERAVARGVQVRVLVDDVGSGVASVFLRRELRRRKIRSAFFLPTLIPWRVTYVNMRNHRKVLVTDGRVGFTGGMNIIENHFQDSSWPIRDVHFRLEGPVVAQFQETFRKDWYFAAGEILGGQTWFPEIEESGPSISRGFSSGPDEDFEKFRWVILSALSNAKKSVRIITPYFIPDQALITNLNLTAMSGITVDIILPADSDLKLVQWASRGNLWQVLDKGCRVWFTPLPFDHGKLMVVDGAWTLFGSSNWDTRSLRLNFEFDVECYDENLARSMEEVADQKMARAHRVTLSEMDSRSLPVKLRDGLARLFTPIL